VALLPGGLEPADVCEQLQAERIEARPAWKPMHLQPVFADREVIGGDAAETIFGRGLCLPSGSGMNSDEEERVHLALAKALAGW
jgi:dTDP-4-amino-4,6-dideoxygalactose transaminase